ncbi:MAG: signal peptidase I [Bacilli bacterium]|nr:signal peptidase I [Bacilli bacterium]
MSANKKILFIQLFMLIVVVFNFFVPFLFDHYKFLIFLLLFLLIGYFFIGIDLSKSANETDVFKKTLFYILIYFLVSYLSGLFIGYARTIYSLTFVNLVKNIMPTMTIIFVCETLRYQFIRKSDNNKLITIFSIIIFVALESAIGFYNYNLTIKDDIYDFIALIVIGSLAKNILMTVLEIKGDFYNAIAYRFIIELYIYVIPIVPDFNPYVRSVLLVLLPAFLSISIINLRERKIDKPKKKEKGNIVFYTVATFLILLICLNSGLFKFQTLVIGSNSMKDYMKKGDVIIVKKLNDKEKANLKVGDILVFNYDNRVIAHRIYKILERNNTRYYVTKGDSNSQADSGSIDNKSVIGISKYRIKNIGLPSIWLNELFD